MLRTDKHGPKLESLELDGLLAIASMSCLHASAVLVLSAGIKDVYYKVNT